MHNQLLQYTLLLAIILSVVMLAQKIKIAAPILLVIAGLPLGFVPALKGIQIDPELIFVIFLPPLLYEAAWNTSWKDFWKWRRVIFSFAFLIVILNSFVIAYASHALIPGFTLATGFLLGGIISPPDAVSATNILRTIKVPKRFIAIVEGESLLNDASSLVIFKFALAAITTGSFVFGKAAISFVLVIGLGILTGLVIALVFYAIHRWLPTTSNIDIILTFITPYAMYLVAESLQCSGVLAVVTGGLFLSSRRQSILSHRSRMQGINVWQAVAFVLNGFVFILIGLEFPVITQALGRAGLPSAIRYSLIITGLLIITRMASTYGTTLFTMFISRFIKVADSNPGFKAPLLLGWTGMRGVVSLAAALSVPVTLHAGMPFPQRNLILFITFTVIVGTLVLQGLTLPALVRRLDMPDPDYTVSPEKQKQLVRKKLSNLSLGILDDKFAAKLDSNNLLKALHLRLTTDLQLLTDVQHPGKKDTADSTFNDYRNIMAELMEAQRHLLMTLNKKENISDEIIRQQLELLDLEQEKMQQHFSADTKNGLSG